MSDIVIPNTYAEWAYLLDRFKEKENDRELLDAMKKGTIEWQSGVAERFSNKLIETINFRLNCATDKFQKEISRIKNNEEEIVCSLISLRKELLFLSDAINLDVIPEKDREQYINLVRKQADTIQKSLEDSSKSDRTGKLTSLIKNNRVNVF